MRVCIRRRDFIATLGGAAAWPFTAHAQRQVLPVIGIINGGTLDANTRMVMAFRIGLATSGYIEGQNVSVEYYWLAGQFDRIPAVVADLVQRQVAVIATPAANTAALAAKAATSTIPVVFGVNDDPVRLGLVASLARPGGNLTGMNFFAQEVVAKQLGLLRQLVPKANRLAVLSNPSNAAASETTLRQAQDSGHVLRLSIDILKASTSNEIEAAFASMASERIEALLIGPDSYYSTRTLQLATLSKRHGIASSYTNRPFAEAGGLMSYGTDLAEVWHQVGAYAGKILNGRKAADLPVVQSRRFEFVLNLQTARALGINVSRTLIASADAVID
jgi:putative tryptophan/tyrosine transport system substrate-binding protein